MAADISERVCEPNLRGVKMLVDSGANASIIPSETAEKLFLPVNKKLSRKMKTATKGGDVMITGETNLGGCLSNTKIASGADCVLVSVADICDRGINVTFTARDQGAECVFHRDGEILSTIQREESRLHYIDIESMRTIELPQNIVVCPCKVQKLATPQGLEDGHNVGKKASRTPSEWRLIVKKVMHLHKCLGHAHFRALASGVRDNVIINTGLSYSDIMSVAEKIECVACALAKWKKVYHVGSGLRPLYPFETVSFDRLGPYSPKAVGGFENAIIATCCTTGFMICKLINNYTGLVLVGFMADLVKFANKFGFCIRSVRFDAGAVENSNIFDDFLARVNIRSCPAGTERQNQNPVERYIQTIKDKVAACMADQAGVGAAFWGLCILMNCKLSTLVPNSLCPSSSPAIEVMGLSTDADKVASHYFGETVVVPRVGRKAAIGQTRNELAWIVGMGNPHNGGWLVQRYERPSGVLVERVNPQSVLHMSEDALNKLTGAKWLPVTRDDGVIQFMCQADGRKRTAATGAPWDGEIDVSQLQWSLDSTWMDGTSNADRVGYERAADIKGEYHMFDVSSISRSKSDDYYGARLLPERYDQSFPDGTTRGIHSSLQASEEGRLPLRHIDQEPPRLGDDDYAPRVHQVQGGASIDNPVGPAEVKRQQETSAEEGDRRYPKRAAKMPDYFAYMAKVVGKAHDPSKPTHKQTMQGPAKEKWDEARLCEKEAHIKAGTFEEAVCPPGHRPVPTKWVYVIKDSGKYKARLVACGNRDPFIGDTYAPTANKAIMWLMFAVMVVLKLFCKVVDVSAAFVAHDINRECYVSVDGKTYRLKKFLYGLVDAPKGFNDGMSKYVKDGGYKQSIFDPCLFYKWISMARFLYVMVHVDDFAIMGSTEESVDEFITYLQARYDITVKPFESYLGMEITRLPDGSRIFRRPKRMQALFDEWIPDPSKVRVPKTPMEKKYGLARGSDAQTCDKGKFQSLLGSLLHLIDVRPDIADAVSRVSQYTVAATNADMEALVRIVRYLYGTRLLGVVIRPGESSGRIFLQLRAFADAAYACARDGRSKFCYSFDLIPVNACDAEPVMYDPDAANSGMFYSKSKFASTVALSSTDAEHPSVVECVKTVIMFRGVLDELRLTQLRPTPVFNDNQSNIILGNQYSGQTKSLRYILPRITWLLAQVQDLTCRMFYTKTEDLPPDAVTKPLETEDFLRKRALLMSGDA